MSSAREPWVILLAGGSGSRLLGRTVLGRSIDRPKQFCRFGEERSLLRTAMDRALRLVDPKRVVVAVCAEHRPWWSRELLDYPPVHVLEQPENRGTAVAILHAILDILRHDPDPVVAALPSDHAVEEEDVVTQAVGTAWRLKRDRRVTLLGVSPDMADSGYGWIVPGREAGPLRSVRAFIEKPSRPTAAALMRHGALWNSFIFTGTGLGVVELFRRTQPDLLEASLENRIERGRGLRSLESFYPSLEPVDFSRDVLEHVPEWLDVLPVDACGWTDLGTPQRLNEWLVRRLGRDAPRASTLAPLDAW